VPSGNGNGRRAAGQDTAFDPKTATDEELGLTWGKDVKPENTLWLWPGMLALEEMALLAGAPGIGKTTLGIELGARITNGSLWPDGKSSAPIGQFVFMGAEDSVKKTLMPRFIAAGGDVSKIAFLKAKFTVKGRDGQSRVKPTSFADLDWWNWWLDRVPDIRLLIVDPVVSYLGAGVDDLKNKDLRAVFERFIDEIVRPRKFCFYAFTHFSKKVDLSNPLEKVTGSGAYAAVPRHVHFAYPSHLQKDAALFMQVKGNLAGKKLPWLHYVIDEKSITFEGTEIQTSSITFLDMIIGMHQEDLAPIMAGQKARPGPAPEKATKLADWLWEKLQGGEWIARRVLAKKALESGEIVGTSPSVASLDRGRKMIPKLHPGWRMEAKKLDFGEGPNKRRLTHWRLVRKVEDDARPADLPF
jgi:hypothetical protein